MKKIIRFVSVILCLVITLNSAVAVSPNGSKKTDAFTVDVVHGIVAGEKLKINAF